MVVQADLQFFREVNLLILEVLQLMSDCIGSLTFRFRFQKSSVGSNMSIAISSLQSCKFHDTFFHMILMSVSFPTSLHSCELIH
mmetsp:Transcript_11916/g.33085  ORF Transcript_11916/g.33085 Transcript_11916/m.33085 type:complete len:84 (+) Transcript_11916:658-909(+)